MSKKTKIHKTVTPSGVFRQPREDLLQDSVSQCAVNQDSLCKVSDFEISIHSKYNLPKLCNVDGKGRAVYWLYKHSLADSESVRNSKVRTNYATDDSLFFTSDSYTNTSIFSAVKNSKNYKLKSKRIKENLSKLRDIFRSSATSDIEIKETYNSYVNLDDLESVGFLLQNDQDLSMDKYNNLMMNLELRRIMLEKRQIEKYKAYIAQTMKNKNGEVTKRHLDNYFAKSKNHLESVKRFRLKKEKLQKTKRNSINSESDGQLLVSTSGLESNDLDHILNQIRFFLYSGKFDEITELQRSQLENYLRILTEESTKLNSDNTLCGSSFRKHITDTIRESLRDMISFTTRRRTSSLYVETDSCCDFFDIPNKTSAKYLRECQAKSNINLSDISLFKTPDPPAVEQIYAGSYKSLQSDLIKHTSEAEIRSADLRYKDGIEEDAADKLIFKQCLLDCNNDLVEFTKAKKPLESKRKAKQKEPKETLHKFKNARSFNESDTFKSLKSKQEKKHAEVEPSNNICITEPDVTSCGELDKIRKLEGKIRERRKSRAKDTPRKSIKSTTKESPKPNIKKDLEVVRKESGDNLKKLKKVDSILLNEPNKSKAEIMVDEHAKDCKCFSFLVSSDSSNDLIAKRAKKYNMKLKSNSFPKARKNTVEYVAYREMRRERKRREKHRREEEMKKVTRSDNLIDKKVQIKINDKENVKVENKMIGNDECTEIETSSKMKPEICDTGSDAIKEVKQDVVQNKNEYKLYLNINSIGDNTLEIRSWKNSKSPDDSVLQTGYFDEVAAIAKEEDVKAVSKMGEKPPRLLVPQTDRSTSNHIVEISDSLIHIDDQNIFKAEEAESMEIFLKNEMLSNLHKSLVPNDGEEKMEGSVNIPIYKQGMEIARITRPSPSCAYTIKKYAQKMNKSTQMFEHVTRNDLYTLQWIHDNLFEININPHTLIVDEKIKEVSEISDVSSQ